MKDRTGKEKHAHGVQTIDFYAFQSGLRDWNGGFKVLSAVLILLLCIVLNDMWVSVTVILTMGIINAAGNHVPIRQYLRLLKIPGIFFVLGCLAVAVEISGKAAGDYNISLGWTYLCINRADIIRAAELFLRGMGAVSAMYFMALSTPADELAWVLQRVHVPRLIVELMHLIYRFIFILTEVQSRMRCAAASRLGYADFWSSCRSFGKIAGNLFIISLKKADTYYDAMISRCYDGEIMFWKEEKKVTGIQIAGMAGYLAVLILVWYMGKS